jgi:hypothetical protein
MSVVSRFGVERLPSILQARGRVNTHLELTIPITESLATKLMVGCGCRRPAYNASVYLRRLQKNSSGFWFTYQERLRSEHQHLAFVARGPSLLIE